MKNVKPKLHFLHQNQDQIDNDCFIKQLHSTVAKNFDIFYISEANLQSGKYTKPATGDKILSVLKLRRWGPLIPFIGKLAETAELYLYDQDPWEAYHDKGACLGVYSQVASMVNVKLFLITSAWWADYIGSQEKLPTKFVRMGAVAQNCDIGKPFHERRYEIGFQGTVHAHRAAFFNELATKGIHTEIIPREPFNKFLQTVQNVGIYLYDDSEGLFINGEPTSFHGLWGKCLTVAARGCFVVRNDDLSRIPYEIDELPTVFPYQHKDEIPAIVEKIRQMTDEERWDKMSQSVERIRVRNDWETVVKAINH